MRGSSCFRIGGRERGEREQFGDISRKAAIKLGLRLLEVHKYEKQSQGKREESSDVRTRVGRGQDLDGGEADSGKCWGRLDYAYQIR